MPNRLARETSPYLQQHKDNPVDWYPWGEEAFQRARAEDKPVLLSVGYSACHWCHVMEHESFANEETAALMNEGFVNIKVDREERPDVDSLYMQAVQQMSGHGGWPMTVFLTPDGAPFYGGTYYPPEPRHGMPSFHQVLGSIRNAYVNRRDEVDRGAAELTEFLDRGMQARPAGAASAQTLDGAYAQLSSRFDGERGGFGPAPKFPQPMILSFLLRYWHRGGDQKALDMVSHTLDQMARGGIFDHLGGGFHRYSVDAGWLVPHFEKMLYDNAQIAAIYTDAYRATGREDFRRTAVATLDYLVREMRDSRGGFYSSQDADSEGVEGKFYIWDRSEIETILGADYHRFAADFDVTEGGNWEGSTILNRLNSSASGEEHDGSLQKLLEERSRRVWPGTDEKVVTSWNAMAISAFAQAAGAFDRPDYLRVAEECADFILRELVMDGRLRRSWRDGDARVDGFLEDVAGFALALLDLFSTTGEIRWLEEARRFARAIIEEYWDPEREMFFDTRDGATDLIVRPRDIYDNATPSGNSTAMEALIRLSRISGDSEFERVAAGALEGLVAIAEQLPQGFGRLLGALQHQLAPPTEVVVLGPAADERTGQLREVANVRYLPLTTMVFAEPGGALMNELPLLADRNLIDGKPTAFVCRHYTCKQPVTEPAALALDLDLIGGGEELQ